MANSTNVDRCPARNVVPDETIVDAVPLPALPIPSPTALKVLAFFERDALVGPHPVRLLH